MFSLAFYVRECVCGCFSIAPVSHTLHHTTRSGEWCEELLWMGGMEVMMRMDYVPLD